MNLRLGSIFAFVVLATVGLTLVLQFASAGAARSRSEIAWRGPTRPELRRMGVSVHAVICQGHPKCKTRLTEVRVAKALPSQTMANKFGMTPGELLAVGMPLVPGGVNSWQGTGTVLLYRNVPVPANKYHSALPGSPWWRVDAAGIAGVAGLGPVYSSGPHYATSFCRYVKSTFQESVQGCGS